MELMPIHPLAELFPQGSDEELRTLSQDIKINGFWGSIITYQNQVLDGRRRQLACKMACVEPVYQEWDGEGGSPTVFVISANLHRRHLSLPERALVAVAAKKLLAKEGEERQKATRAKPGQAADKRGGTGATTPSDPAKGGKSRDQAAKLSGVSGRTVDNAEKVMEKGTPQLQEAMKSGAIPITRAAAVADMTLEEQIAAVAKAESQPRRTGVDEDKRAEQEPRSGKKWLWQHMDLGRSKEQAHKRVDELWDKVREEWKAKKKKIGG